MANIAGRNTITGNTTSQANQGSNNQYGSQFTMPQIGTIQYLNVYCGGFNGNSTITNIVLCLWDGSGNLLGQTATIAAPAYPNSVNGQAWQRAALLTPYLASASQVLYVGLWRDPSHWAVYSYKNSGGTIHPGVSSGTATVSTPGNLAIGTSTTGQMSAYVEYVTGGVKFQHLDGTYTKHPVKTQNVDSSWNWHPVRQQQIDGSWWHVA